MNGLATAVRLLLALSVLAILAIQPGQAALGREATPEWRPFSTDLSPVAAQPQAEDAGWVLDLALESGAGTPAAVIVDDAGDRIYAGGTDGWIHAFDRHTSAHLERARVDHTVSTLAADGAGRRLYAGGERYADQSQRVSVLRLPGLEVEATVEISTGGMFRQLLHDRAEERLYALVLKPGQTTSSAEVVLLDAGANPTGEVWQLGPSAQAAALDSVTGRLFTITPDFATPAAVVRAYSREGTMVLEGRLQANATQLVLDESRRRLYAIADNTPSSGRLDILDADSLTLASSLPTSRQPSALALDPTTGRLWLTATRAATDVTPVLETVDPAVPTTVAVANYPRPPGGHAPQVMAVDDSARRLWLANLDNSLTVVDLDSRQPVATVITSEILSDVGVDEGTGRVFLLSSNADSLVAIDPAGGAVIGRLHVGRNPTSMRIDAESGRVYVVNQTSRSLSVIDGRSLATVAEPRLATPPAANGWDVDPQLNRVFLSQPGEVVALAADTGQEVARAALRKVSTPTASLVVDRDTHRVYVTAYASAILDGETLAPLGELPGQPLSLAIDRVNRRAYGVNWCTAKSCGIRTYVYDLLDHSLLAQLEGVGEIKAVNPNRGHLYFPGQPAFVVDAFSFERVATDWRATDIAADPQRGRVYLLDDSRSVLRAVPDRYPTSELTVRDRRWAKIQIVWPHNGAPVSEANLANVGAMIYEPTTFKPVSADFSANVQLWRAVNNEPAVPVAQGTKRVAPWPIGSTLPCDSPGHPIWEFNDVDISPARDPNARVFFYLMVDGARVATNVWGHAVDARTYFPRQDVPEGTAPVGEAVDTRVQIVWPNDGFGVERPVSEAAFANIGVDVYNHGTRTSVPADWNPVVQLYRSLNNGVEQMVGTGREEMVSEGGQTWPRWVFDGVDVRLARDPANKYYFRAVVDGKTTYAGVWSHGADGRTYFPQQDIPVSPCR